MRKVWKGALTASTAAALFMGLAVIAAPTAPASAEGVPATGSGSVGPSVSGPGLTEDQLDINYGEQYLTVRNLNSGQGEAKEVGFAVTTADKSGNVKQAADAKWEWYTANDNGEVRIDLSSLSATKDNYVQFKGGAASADAKPLTVKFPASEKKLKVTYKIDSGAAALTLKSDGQDVTDTSVYEYRTQYGTEWQDTLPSVTGDVMDSYEVRGAKLVVRKKASEGTNLTEDAAKGIWTAGSFAGKEAKVSIKKQANAPKMKTVYPQGVVTVPKGSEYRTASNNNDFSAWVSSGDKAVVIPIPDKAVSGAGTIEVRKAAAAKKIESKIGRLKYDKGSTLTKAGNTPVAVSGATLFSGNEIMNGTSKVATASGDVNDKKKSLKIKNEITGDTIEVYFGTATEDPNAILAEKGKVKGSKTIKGGKDASYKPTVYSGKKLWIRIQGRNAKKSTNTPAAWPTQFVEWATIGTVQ